MLTEAIIGAVVKAVIGYTLVQTGVGDRVRSALDRDPTERAFAAALTAAYETARQEHPDLAAQRVS